MYVYFIAMQVVLYTSYMQLLEWHYNYCIINIRIYSTARWYMYIHKTYGTQPLCFTIHAVLIYIYILQVNICE